MEKLLFDVYCLVSPSGEYQKPQTFACFDEFALDIAKLVYSWNKSPNKLDLPNFADYHIAKIADYDIKSGMFENGLVDFGSISDLMNSDVYKDFSNKLDELLKKEDENNG